MGKELSKKLDAEIDNILDSDEDFDENDENLTETGVKPDDTEDEEPTPDLDSESEDDEDEDEDDDDLDSESDDEDDETEDDLDSESDDDEEESEDEDDIEDEDDEETEDDDEEDEIEVIKGDLPNGFTKEDVLALSKANKQRQKQIRDQEETIKSLEEKIKSYEDRQVVDIKNHPEFVKKRNRLERNVSDALLDLNIDNSDILHNRWASYLNDVAQVQQLESFQDRKAGLDKVRLQIAKDLKLVEADTERLDPDGDSYTINQVNQALKPFREHADELNDLVEFSSDLQTKAEKNLLEVGYKDYLKAVEPTERYTSSIFTFDDKDIQKDPYSVASVAAKAIKTPRNKIRAEHLAEMIKRLRHGPEVMSQDEIDKRVRNGQDLTKIRQAEEKKLKEYEEKYIPRIHQALILWDEIEELIAEREKNIETEKKKKKTKTIVRKAVKTKPPRKKPKEEAPLSLEEHRNQVMSLLD